MWWGKGWEGLDFDLWLREILKVVVVACIDAVCLWGRSGNSTVVGRGIFVESWILSGTWDDEWLVKLLAERL